MRWFRMGMSTVVACGVASGCATATKSGSNPDANNGQRDSNGMQFFDAPNGQHDAPMNSGPDAAQAITLNEAGDTTVATGQSTACADTNPLSSTYGNTADNIWYRAYQLSDYPAITGGFHITNVTFGVDGASSAGTITVKLGSYTGSVDSLDTTKISSLTSATTTPPNTSGTELVQVPITADIAAGGKFVVQVSAPNDVNNGFFYIGATNAAQTHPGYWSSSACSQSTPAATTSAGHIIITVDGTH